jgi:hypothetical protein
LKENAAYSECESTITSTGVTSVFEYQALPEGYKFKSREAINGAGSEDLIAIQ